MVNTDKVLANILNSRLIFEKLRLIFSFTRDFNVKLGYSYFLWYLLFNFGWYLILYPSLIFSVRTGGREVFKYLTYNRKNLLCQKLFVEGPLHHGFP